jgi:hypothetical protein
MLNSSGGLLGRAILWDLDSIKLMDRIYTTNDEDLQFHFKKWGQKTDFYIKANKIGPILYILNRLVKRKENLESILSYLILDLITIHIWTHSSFDREKGVLTNYISNDSENRYVRTLSGSDGNTHDSDYLRLDDINRIFRHRNDTVYVDYIKLYTSVIIYNILILIINIFLEKILSITKL